MYVFVHGNFDNTRLALGCVEDCAKRGLTDKELTIYVSAAGDEKYSQKEPPVVEEPVEEAPKGRKKKDDGPVFDPAGYLYWGKLKKDFNVKVIDPDQIDSLDIPREEQLALHGSKTLLTADRIVVLVNQPTADIDEKFD